MSSPEPSPPSIARLYDDLVADHYDDDAFGIIGTSRAIGLEQIRACGRTPRRICDFGMGTGDALVALRRDYPEAALWGVDVSARMIERARAKLEATGGLRGVTLHHGDALETEAHLPSVALDLAITHFLLAYVDARKIIATVKATLAPGGLWSIVTSTSDSFPKLASLARQLLPPESHPELHSSVPEKVEDLEAEIGASGFSTLARSLHRHPLTLSTFEDLVQFARHSGWFTSDVLARYGDAEIEDLRPAMSDLFPIHDEARVAVLVCQKR